MAEYGKIERRIWNSHTFHSLTDDGKILWMYLLTCPHSNMLGCFVLKPGYALEDLEWEKNRYKKALSELLSIDLSNGQGKGLIDHDPSNHLILIKNHLEEGRNPITNGNQERGAIKILSELPKSPLISILKDLFKALYKEQYKALYQALCNTVAVTVAVAVTVTESTAESSDDLSKQDEPIFISIPLIDKSEYPITENQVEEFKTLYPAIDIHQTLRDIRGWNLSNPKNRKTRQGILRHVNGWLKKAQDKAPRQGDDAFYEQQTRDFLERHKNDKEE